MIRWALVGTYLTLLALGGLLMSRGSEREAAFILTHGVRANHRITPRDLQFARRSRFLIPWLPSDREFEGRYAVRDIQKGAGLRWDDTSVRPELLAPPNRFLYWARLGEATPRGEFEDADVKGLADLCVAAEKRSDCLTALPIAAFSCDRNEEKCSLGVWVRDADRAQLVQITSRATAAKTDPQLVLRQPRP